MASEIRQKSLIIHLPSDSWHVRKVTQIMGSNCLVRHTPIVDTGLDKSSLSTSIEWCDVLVVLISAAAKHSEGITWAVNLAQTLNKRVVAIWLEDTHLQDLPVVLDELANAVVPAAPALVAGALSGDLNEILGPSGNRRPERQIVRHRC